MLRLYNRPDTIQTVAKWRSCVVRHREKHGTFQQRGKGKWRFMQPALRPVIANPQGEAIQCTRVDCFALYDCINRLPARSREILLLDRIKGLKQKEIAEKLNISLQTVKNGIWMSLQKLRRRLELKGVF
jgi:DNA-binding NarL/FixJ family response regulator